jgi:hypothetical protein
MRRGEFARDWVMLDNRRVMHQANADYDMNEHMLKERGAGLTAGQGSTAAANTPDYGRRSALSEG